MFEKINELFDALEKKFPYTDMGDGFRGNHHLFKRGDLLIVIVWAKGKAFRDIVEASDLEDIPKFIASISKMIDTWEDE